MFRFAFLAIALVALGAILASGLEGATLLVLAPLFLVAKVFFIMLFVGVIGGFWWRNHGDGPQRPPWTRRRPRRDQVEPETSREDLFDEWHRHAHAREEVDRWVEPLD